MRGEQYHHVVIRSTPIVMLTALILANAIHMMTKMKIIMNILVMTNYGY